MKSIKLFPAVILAGSFLASCGGGSSAPAPVITVPSAPTNPIVTPGDGSAIITFTVPASNGGSEITGYTVISNPAGGVDSNAGSTSWSHVVTGLNKSTSYTFTVTASNATGVSAASNASAAATPNGAPSKGMLVASLQIARTGHTATLLQSGKVLVAGGVNSKDTASNLAKAELYDPVTNDWTPAGTLTTPGVGAATLLPNGKVLAIHGASAELYDPASNSWSNAGQLGVDLASGYSATLLPSGKVLVAGGINSANIALSNAELYDPATNTWTAASPLATARSAHSATLLLNGKVLVSGGNYGHGPLASAEMYDPASNAWTAAASLATPHASHTATLLSSGKVLVTAYDADLELYDPATNAWTAAGTFTVPQRTNWRYTATLLPNGKVLVAGGEANLGVGYFYIWSSLARTELYDPATNAWAASGDLAAARLWHTATLLPNGKVLIVGGTFHYQSGSSLLGVSDALASAEIYDPSINP